MTADDGMYMKKPVDPRVAEEMGKHGARGQSVCGEVVPIWSFYDIRPMQSMYVMQWSEKMVYDADCQYKMKKNKKVGKGYNIQENIYEDDKNK